MSGRRRRISLSSASPSMPAMRTSDRMTSKAPRSTAPSAASASAAVSATWPRWRRCVARWLRMFFSSSTIRTLAMSAPRQLEHEAAAAPHSALQVNPTAVSLNDIAYDGQPEPGGAALAAVGALREALEDALALVDRDARTGVGDRQPDAAVVAARFDVHVAAARRVTQRVRQ